MTDKSDSTDSASTLAKMVKCASFDITAYPKLEDLANFAGKVCATRLSKVIDTPIPPANAIAMMQELKVATDSFPDAMVGYWFGDNTEENAMLVGFSASFVGGLSEALLGGAFDPPKDGGAPTALDSELTQIFARELGDEISAHLVSSVGMAPTGELSFKTATTSPKKYFKEGFATALFMLEIPFQLPTGELPAAMKFFFPVEYLDRRGMLQQASKSGIIQQQNTKWYADMLENVYQSEIELPVLIANYKMTLSELSKLKVGQYIPLEDNSHNSLDITLKTDKDVVTVCKGRLGTFKENKAAKVASDVGIY